MAETKLRAMRVRRNPWITALSCAPWAISAALTLATLVTHAPYAALAPHFALGAVFAFIAAWRRKPYARLQRVDVRVDDRVLHIDDETVPRERISRAEILPTAGGPLVRVNLKKGLERDLGVSDEGVAHELMTALGFDASQRIAKYRAGSLALTRYRWAPILLVPILWALIALGGVLHISPAMFAVPLMLVAVAALYASRTSLVVGVDGVLIRWLWVRRFIATNDILGVDRFVQGSGRNRVTGIVIASGEGSLRLPLGEDETAMVRQRIRDVLSLARSSTHVADEALLLARGELPMREWILRLKALGAGATATLRTAAVMPEQLWRVAADPAQPATARVAAAIALSPTLDRGSRARLEDIARATAEPRLRVALERAPDAPDDELERTLDELGSSS